MLFIRRDLSSRYDNDYLNHILIEILDKSVEKRFK